MISKLSLKPELSETEKYIVCADTYDHTPVTQNVPTHSALKCGLHLNGGLSNMSYFYISSNILSVFAIWFHQAY